MYFNIFNYYYFNIYFEESMNFENILFNLFKIQTWFIESNNILWFTSIFYWREKIYGNTSAFLGVISRKLVVFSFYFSRRIILFVNSFSSTFHVWIWLCYDLCSRVKNALRSKKWTLSFIESWCCFLRNLLSLKFFLKISKLILLKRERLIIKNI